MKTVFLSSTGRDLQAYRDAVYAALSKLHDWKVVRMEDFTAQAGTTTHEYCRQEAAACDLFIGILGHCYGSIPEGHTTSYTEQEYDSAAAAGRPRLVFLAPNDFPVPANLLSEAPQGHAQKQQAFRTKAEKDQHPGQPAAFASPETLAAEVQAAMYNYAQRQPVIRPQSSLNMEVKQLHFFVKLLNRNSQETAIRARLQDMKSRGGYEPLLVIMPGRMHDCHRHFIQRFARHDFKNIVDENVGCDDLEDMEWRTGAPDVSMMVQDICQRISGMRTVNDAAALCERLRTHPKPFCFTHYINETRWADDDGRLVRAWVKYVTEDWPRSETGIPIIAFLCIVLGDGEPPASPLHRLLNWSGDKGDRLSSFVRQQAAINNPRLVVTRDLNAIEAPHILEWRNKIRLENQALANALENAENEIFRHSSAARFFDDVYDDLIRLLHRVTGTVETTGMFAR